MMQGCCTSFCTSSHAWCYATVCRLTLPHIHDATLVYVVLHFLTYMMQLHCMSSCTSSHTWCTSTVCRLALPHIHDARLLYVFLHFLTCMMLRYCMSSCPSSHTWCYASVRRLALPHIHDATPLYVVLHFLTYMMQLHCMSSCTSLHIWCYAAVHFFALPHIYGKTVPTKTSPSSLQKLWRTLSAEKKIVPLRCFTYPVKSTRVLFQEIELWERCKTTVICGMKSMTNTANVENAGSINNPPGCLWLSQLHHLSTCLHLSHYYPVVI